jgi:hypothetical protein
MEILFITLLILVVGALCVACFFIGARVGQAASRGENITLPKIDPMKPIREHRERKEADREQERYNTILENIERYDGTSSGQKDIPRF